MRNTFLALTLCVLMALPAAAADPALGKALAALAADLEASPRDAALLTDYANLLVRAGRPDDALVHYRTALEIDPMSRVTLYNLGLLELELGRPRPAGRLFKRSLAVDEGFARGHYALGSALAARHQNLQAVRHFSTAFNLDPKLMDPARNPEILFNELATWAAMESYLTHSVERGTRLYNNPQPIVGLLIEGLAPPAEPAGAEAADTESDR